MGKQSQRDYASFETMLPQGARSRYTKALAALNSTDDLLPETALDGTAADLRQAIKHLATAMENLTELIVYRKMLGVD